MAIAKTDPLPITKDRANPQPSASSCAPRRQSPAALRLGLISLAWMAVECGVSAYAALTAHSPALLAFGSDSLVEFLSALVLLSAWLPGSAISERAATRAAAVLLYALAAVVGAVATASLTLHWTPARSFTGMAITAAALLIMPVLATAKRREAGRTGNAVLAADAVQSATCAYLALLTLAGLALNAAFGIAWFDSAAALLAIPLLIREGRSAWQGQTCGC